jgi:type II secretory pathway component GspD/PulD (secretin)
MMLLLIIHPPLFAQEGKTRLEQIVDAVRAQSDGRAIGSSGGERSGSEPVEEVPSADEMIDLDQPSRIPVDRPSTDDVEVTKSNNGNVSVVARNAAVADVLESLAEAHGFNLVLGTSATSRPLSISMRDVPIDKAIDVVVSTAGLTWVRRNEIVLVTSIESGQANLPSVQNRTLRVFEIDYASIPDVETSIQGLLSPAGQVTVLASAKQNVRQSRNLIVVEDLPEFVDRIAQYIDQVDQPPRQVMIEARVLQVRLTDDYVHGVSLLYKLAAGQGSTLSLATKGFANLAAPNAALFTLSSDNLSDVIELLETTLDSKTLASPRVLAVNGQESRIQVGGQLGFRVLTTTQTSTLEQVQFLNTGVILRVTPFITRDNQIMMTVQPSVSTGQINTAGLPEAQTTEVVTNVILPDNHGMIIGGLIQESYEDRQSKIPVIGDIKLIGRLFQRRQVDRRRTEVIIALIPRIVPYDCQTSERDREELARTDAPIYKGPLAKNPRPWEPRLYDATENPRVKDDIIHHHKRMRDIPPTVVRYPTEPASRACMNSEDGGESCDIPSAPAISPTILLPNESLIPEASKQDSEVQLMPVEVEPEPPMSSISQPGTMPNQSIPRTNR